MAVNPLATGGTTDTILRSQPASWFKRNFTTTNFLKYGGTLALGGFLGSTALSALRPTFSTGSGNIYAPQTAGTDWMGQIMQLMMPLMMMGIMLPMMTSMFTSKKSVAKEDEG